MASLTTINITTSAVKLPKSPIMCYYCNGNHMCRDCPQEIAMAPVFKKNVGTMMEYWVSNNLVCPGCDRQSLTVIGNHTPSLDIVCKTCYKKFEVKSKCLSVAKLPNDIRLNHGSYYDFIHKLNEGLNLFVVIYGVNRFDKTITIKEILYVNNTELCNPSLVNIEKRNDSILSTIFIKNKSKLTKLKPSDQAILTFKPSVK
jgi:hypothetical protein